jgi:hypothetical protein
MAGKKYGLNDGYSIEQPLPQDTSSADWDKAGCAAEDVGAKDVGVSHSIKGATVNPTGN